MPSGYRRTGTKRSGLGAGMAIQAAAVAEGSATLSALVCMRSVGAVADPSERAVRPREATKSMCICLLRVSGPLSSRPESRLKDYFCESAALPAARVISEFAGWQRFLTQRTV